MLVHNFAPVLHHEVAHSDLGGVMHFVFAEGVLPHITMVVKNTDVERAVELLDEAISSTIWHDTLLN